MEAQNNTERRYFLVSIKHSEYPKNRLLLILWGSSGKTPDNAARCFAGYTTDPDQAEVYSMGDLQKFSSCAWIKTDEPVKMCLDLVKKWKKFDSVAVDVDQYRQYYSFI